MSLLTFIVQLKFAGKYGRRIWNFILWNTILQTLVWFIVCLANLLMSLSKQSSMDLIERCCVLCVEWFKLTGQWWTYIEWSGWWTLSSWSLYFVLTLWIEPYTSAYSHLSLWFPNAYIQLFSSIMCTLVSLIFYFVYCISS